MKLTSLFLKNSIFQNLLAHVAQKLKRGNPKIDPRTDTSTSYNRTHYKTEAPAPPLPLQNISLELCLQKSKGTRPARVLWRLTWAPRQTCSTGFQGHIHPPSSCISVLTPPESGASRNSQISETCTYTRGFSSNHFSYLASAETQDPIHAHLIPSTLPGPDHTILVPALIFRREGFAILLPCGPEQGNWPLQRNTHIHEGLVTWSQACHWSRREQFSPGRFSLLD